MKALKTMILTGSLALTACSTIIFDNGPHQLATQAPVAAKHHGGGIFELVEFSPPKNLQTICNGNDWDSIKTEMAFIDGVLKTVVPAGIYSPRSTYTECRSQPALMTSGVEQPSVDASPMPSAEGSGTNDSSTRSSGSGDTTPKDKLVGCSEKYKHLFFGCE